MVYASSSVFVKDRPEMFTYEATNEVFNLAKKEDVVGGILFLDDAPNPQGAMAIISAGLKKVIYRLPVETVEETAACQLLEQYGIETVYNPDIITCKEDGVYHINKESD